VSYDLDDEEDRFWWKVRRWWGKTYFGRLKGAEKEVEYLEDLVKSLKEHHKRELAKLEASRASYSAHVPGRAEDYLRQLETCQEEAAAMRSVLVRLELVDKVMKSAKEKALSGEAGRDYVHKSEIDRVCEAKNLEIRDLKMKVHELSEQLYGQDYLTKGAGK